MSVQSGIPFVRNGFKITRRYADTMAQSTVWRQFIGAQDGLDDPRLMREYIEDGGGMVPHITLLLFKLLDREVLRSWSSEHN
jgi:hypothetical protein